MLHRYGATQRDLMRDAAVIEDERAEAHTQMPGVDCVCEAACSRAPELHARQRQGDITPYVVGHASGVCAVGVERGFACMLRAAFVSPLHACPHAGPPQLHAPCSWCMGRSREGDAAATPDLVCPQTAPTAFLERSSSHSCARRGCASIATIPCVPRTVSHVASRCRNQNEYKASRASALLARVSVLLHTSMSSDCRPHSRRHRHLTVSGRWCPRPCTCGATAAAQAQAQGQGLGVIPGRTCV